MPSSAGEDSLQGSDGKPDRDSPSRDPSPDGDLSVDQGRGSRPVSPRNKGCSRNSLPRTGASDSNPSYHSSKRRRSSSDSDSSRSDVSRGRSRHKRMKSRHRSRSLSRPKRRRHHHRRSRSSISRARHYRSRSSRSGSRFRRSTVETELKVTQSALGVHIGCTPFVED